MLVLTRKQGESIIVDDLITVTVLEIKGNVVRLGIEAPRDVSIMRSELCAHSPELELAMA
jgi:carbon storage regulator